MAVRTLWMDTYCIEQTASLTAKPTFASTAIGVEGTGASGGKFLFPITEHSHLKPTSSTQENELAVGRSDRHFLEYNQTISDPSSVTVNFLANAYNVSLFMWLLFQTAAGEGDGTGDIKIMSVTPYTAADMEIYAAVTRLMGGTAGNADTVSQYMPGCICRSLTLSSETGGLLMGSAELIGASWAKASNDLGTVSYNTLTFSQKAPLKFQDMTMEMNNQEVNTPSFSITFNNNAAAQFYNRSTIQRYVLGRLNIEGNFAIPWGDVNQGGNQQLDDFIAGTDKFVEFYWGADNGDADNALSIRVNLRYTDTDMGDAEGEIITNINYAGVYDGTYNAIEMYAGYDSNYLVRGAPSATTTSTSTSTTSTTTTS